MAGQHRDVGRNREQLERVQHLWAPTQFSALCNLHNRTRRHRAQTGWKGLSKATELVKDSVRIWLRWFGSTARKPPATWLSAQTVAASESLGRLVKTQTGPSWRISDAAGLGWCLRIYILVSSQEMLLLVAQGPHFENQCIQLTHFLGWTRKSQFVKVKLWEGLPNKYRCSVKDEFE